MSERFGIADHDAQLPGHAPENPTPSYPVGGAGGFDFPAYNPPTYAGAPGGSYAGAPVGSYAGTSAGPYVRPKRSMILAVVLATVFGPLGLFYVNILSGIAALVIIPVVVRTLAFMIALGSGGDMNTVYRVAVPILWCITIPWSMIGVKVRNARIDRAQHQPV
jgi:hypothetical protein